MKHPGSAVGLVVFVGFDPEDVYIVYPVDVVTSLVRIAAVCFPAIRFAPVEGSGILR